ncbi:MAG: GAF domain-containing sensor histidine kinase [Chloroflexales bacterium]
MDTPTDPALDRLARLATRLLRAPIALVALTDADQQGVRGYAACAAAEADLRERALPDAFCAAVVAARSPLIIADSYTDQWWQTHPAIIGVGRVAYLGVPITTADGVVRGAFGVLDRIERAPRHWSVDDHDILRDLTTLVVAELDRQAAARVHAADVRERAINNAKLALIDRQIPLVLWTTDTALCITSIIGSGIADLPRDPAPFLGQPVDQYLAHLGMPRITLQASLDAHRQVLAGTAFAYQRELWGQIATVHIEPLRDDAGQIIGCVGGALPLTAPMRLLHEVQHSRDRLHTLSIQLLHVQEDERRALARELHDQIGQELTIIQMNLQDLLDGDPAQLPELVAASIATVEHVLAQVRDIALNLRPSQLDDLGLAEALRWYSERNAAQGRFALTFDVPALIPRPPVAVETTCFRIAQEAMTNILRSAHAAHVWLTIRLEASALTLTVRDDGRGFDLAAAHARAVGGTSLGLLNIEERAALIGGRATIESTPGQGTTVRAWLPLAPPAAASDS